MKTPTVKKMRGKEIIEVPAAAPSLLGRFFARAMERVLEGRRLLMGWMSGERGSSRSSSVRVASRRRGRLSSILASIRAAFEREQRSSAKQQRRDVFRRSLGGAGMEQLEGRAMMAAFSQGNLALLVAGSSATNTTGSIVEINTTTAGQTAVQTIAIPGTGTDAYRMSSSATSTGYVSRSNDGTLLSFTGANSTDTTSNVNTLTTRGVFTVNNAGSGVVKQATYTGSSGNQARGATSLDNSTWYIGDQGGFYSNNTTTASPSGNIRSVKAFGGTVYAFTASTSAAPVGTISAATGGTYSGLSGLANGATSRQDFYMIQSGSNGSTFDVMYVLDATSATAGTILKYSRTAGADTVVGTSDDTWSANSTYTTSFGGFGLAAADRDASNTTAGAFLYVSSGTGATTANNVIRLTDTAGYNSNISITTGSNVTLYTSATGTIIKGLDFAPVASASPTLTAATIGSAITGTYGTASTGTSFIAQGTNLTGSITATAQSGFEVSTALGSGYGSSVSVASGTTVYVRTAATRTPGTFNSTTAVVLSGGGASSSANITTSASGNSVAQKALTITGLTAANKVYDRSTNASVSGTAAVSGLVGSDTVTLGGTAVYSFSSAAVGNSKSITTTGYTITGGQSSYYTLTQPSFTANITAAPLTVTGAAATSRVYNRTTSVAITGGSLSGVISGDTVTLGGTASGTVASASVGTAQAVTVTGYSISGTDSGNYSISQPTGLTADITAAPLTITGASATSRAYDATTTIAITGGSLSGVISGDTVTLGGTASGTVASASVGTAKAVTVTGYSISGTDSGNYSISQPTGLTADVSTQALTITGLSAANKNFDGGTTVDVSGTPTYSGLVGGESFDVTGSVTWAFADATVGTSKTLSRTGSYDAPSSNYSVTQPTLTANISAVVASAPTINSISAGNSQLQVFFSPPSSNGGVAITDYKYSTDDGASFTSAGSTSSPITITGLTNGTSYSVKLLAVNSVGDGAASAASSGTPEAPASPTISASGLSGTLSTTYGTASAERTFTVSGAALTGDISVSAPTGIEISTTSGSGFADSLILSPSSGVVSSTTVYARLKATANVSGNYNSVSITLSSTGASNATVTTATTGNLVNPKSLSISAPSVAGKSYDATSTAGSVTVGTLSGFVGSETVTATGSATAYSSANAGSYSTTVSYVLADGTNGGLASNYTLASESATGVISPKSLTISAPSVASKAYNGSTAAGAVTAGTLSGFVGTETVTATGSATAYSSANVGSYSTTVSYLLADGTNGGLAANYSLASDTATGSVSAATLTITAAAKSKTYGDVDPALTYNSSGLIGADSISGSLARASGDTVGTYAITQGSLDAGSNYSISFNGANLTVNAKSLTISGASASGKVYDGTTAISISGGSLVGIVGSDDVTLGGSPVGTAASKAAGSQTVTVSGYSLSGTAASNYTLSQPTGLTATISQAPLTVTGASATNRAYNASTTVAITGGTLSGVIGSDAVTLGGTAAGTIASANAGSGKAVAVTGYSISGTDSGNYSLSQPTGLTVDISKANQTITFGTLAGKTTADAAFTLGATTTATGLTISYSSSNTAVATVSGSTVTIVGVGSTTITASQAGDDNYNAATSATQSLAVTAGPTTLAAGDVMILQFDADNPDKFTFVTLVDLNPGTVINFTDNGFASPTTGATSEGFLTFTVPAATTYTAGMTFTWTSGMTLTGTPWNSAAPTNFAFNASGDQLFAFQGATASWATQSGITLISGLIERTTWLTSGTVAAATSYQPSGLSSSYIVSLSTENGYFANATTTASTVSVSGTKASLQSLFADGTNKWYNNATGPLTAPTLSVSITQAQSITFGSLTAKTYGDSTFNLAATASSGLGITYTSSDPTVASISGSTVTILKAGSTTITASQAGNSTYAAATSVNQSLTVAQKAISVTANAVSKTYGASDPALTYSADALVGSDAFSGSLSRASGSNVGTYAISQGSLTAGSNYTINFTGANLTINTKALTATGTAANKVYDGSDAASVTIDLTGVVGSDAVTGSASGTFADKNAGNAKTVTIGAVTLGGAAASNYTVGSAGTTTANITVAPLTVTGLSATNRTYDGTTAASLSGTASLSGVVGSDDVSLAGTASASFGTKTVGTGKAVTVTGYSLTGTDSGNYSLSQPSGLTANISALALTGSITASNKMYDGSNVATIASRTLSGAIVSDDVSYVGGTATFASSAVGTSITVTATGLSLSGADAGNYSVNSTATTTADIAEPTGLSQTITFDNPGSKTYGDAAFDLGATSTSGLTVSYEIVSGPATLSGNMLTITGVGSVTVRASQAGNYNYNPATPVERTFSVAQKSLSVSISASNRAYDGTTAASVTYSLSGIVGSDAVTASGSAVFASKNVGTGVAVDATGITLGGTAAANYSLASSSASTTANISAVALTATITASSKVYNGSDSASVTYSLSGVVGTETVTASGSASFSNKNVGTGKTVTATGITLDGADAGNYTVNSSATATANITAKSISATGITASNKSYDRGTSATLATGGAGLSGVESGDSVSLNVSSATGAFASAGVGAGKTVTVSGLALTGDDASNYTLASYSTTADITAIALTASFTASNKTYDGTTTSTGTYNLSGVLTGDVVTASGTSTFASVNVGSAIAVNVTGITLSGADGGNYSVNSTASSSANITAVALTPVVTISNKAFDNTTSATIASRSLTGVISGDVVTLNGGTATFVDAVVGTGKTVSVTGLSLTGANAGNYTVSSTATATANITAQTTVTLNRTITMNPGQTIQIGSALLSATDGNATPTMTYTVTSGPTSGSLKKNGTVITTFTSTDLNASSSLSSAIRYTTTGTAGSTDSFTVSVSNGAGSTVTGVVVNISVVAATTAVSFNGTTYTQNFDDLLPSPIPTDRLTLPSASVLPQGWIVVESGTNAESSIQIDNGGSTTGDTFLYGSTGSNERALGSFSSGSLTSQYGLAIVNNSGSTINNFTLSYRGEQWKNGRNSTAVNNTLTFDYSTTASSLGAATGFTSVSGLTFTAPQGGTTTPDLTLDGNDSANRQDITSTVTGISWAAGATLYLRWADINETGNDDGLGIDNISFSATLTPTVAVTAPSGAVYDGTAKNATATVNGASSLGGVSPTLTYYSGSTATGTALSGAPVNAGTYTVVGSYAGSTGYTSATSAATTFTIAQKAINVSAAAVSKTYGASDPALTYSADALVGSDAFSGSLSRAAGSNVGTYAISVGSLTAGSNYSINFTGADLTINQKSINVTADAASKTYGAADPTLSYSADALVGSDAFSGSLSRASGSDVGTYAINVGSLTAGGNYAINFTGADLTINQKSINVSAVAASKTYGASDPALTYSADALVGSDAFSGSLSRASGSDVGTYAISQGSLTAGNNYAINFTGADLTINVKAINVSAAAVSKTYGAADPALTYSADALVGSDAFSGSLSRASGANVGTYAISQGSLTAGSNYSINFTGADLTINAKAINVSAAAVSKTYGASDPALTYSADALVGSDAFSGSLSRASGSNVGTYAISQGSLTAGSNYSINFTGANLTINAKTLTASGTAASKTYDRSDSASVTITLDGVVGSDAVTGTASGTFADKNVGSGKTVTIGAVTLGGAAAGNYTVGSAGTATADISAKALTGTVTINNKVFDGTNSATIATRNLSGVVSGDTVSYVGGTATFDDSTGTVGSDKPVTVTGLSLSGDDAGNYTVNDTATATANITNAVQSQTITFNPIGGKTYGDAAFGLVASSTSGLAVTLSVISGPATISGSTLTITGAGDVVVEATQSGNDEYYAATAVQRSFTVSQKSINVTANAVSKTYGAADPALTYSADALVGSDAFSGSVSRA